MKNLVIRKAVRADVKLIFSFIKGLAKYEKMENEVITDEKSLEINLFDKHQANVLIAEYDGIPAGFALYFYNFSTFLGKHGLYLEDLFVKEEFRGKGIGNKVLSELANIALEEDCGRLEWWCLDWNEPSIDFYKRKGAVPMDEWTTFRVTGKALEELAK